MRTTKTAKNRKPKSQPHTPCQWTGNPFNPFIEDAEHGYPQLCPKPATRKVVFAWTKGPSAGDSETWQCCDEHYGVVIDDCLRGQGRVA